MAYTELTDEGGNCFHLYSQADGLPTPPGWSDPFTPPVVEGFESGFQWEINPLFAPVDETFATKSEARTRMIERVQAVIDGLNDPSGNTVEVIEDSTYITAYLSGPAAGATGEADETMEGNKVACTPDENDPLCPVEAPTEPYPSDGCYDVAIDANGDLITNSLDPDAPNPGSVESSITLDNGGILTADSDGKVSFDYSATLGLTTTTGSDFWETSPGSYQNVSFSYALPAPPPEPILVPNYHIQATNNARAGYYTSADDDIVLIRAELQNPADDSNVLTVVDTATGNLIAQHFHPNPGSYDPTNTSIYSTAVSPSYYVSGHAQYFITSEGYGDVLVYNKSDNTLRHRIVNPHPVNPEFFAAKDYFGYAVACNDQYLVITSPFQTEFPESLSDFYVYNIDTGAYIARYNVDSVTTGAGRYMHMYGNKVVLWGYSDGVFNRLYVFDVSTGSAALTIDLVANYDNSSDVIPQISEDYVAVGCSTNNDDRNIYVYSATTGALVNTIAVPDEVQEFYDAGYSMSYPLDYDIRGNRLAASVGSLLDAVPPTTTTPGKVYEFDILTGEIVRELQPANITDDGTSTFGQSVEYTESGYLVITDPFSDVQGGTELGSGNGAVYIYPPEE